MCHTLIAGSSSVVCKPTGDIHEKAHRDHARMLRPHRIGDWVGHMQGKYSLRRVMWLGRDVRNRLVSSQIGPELSTSQL
jgi:hypothetical protein